jgi:hypothetical protein
VHQLADLGQRRLPGYCDFDAPVIRASLVWVERIWADDAARIAQSAAQQTTTTSKQTKKETRSHEELFWKGVQQLPRAQRRQRVRNYNWVRPGQQKADKVFKKGQEYAGPYASTDLGKDPVDRSMPQSIAGNTDGE